MGRHLPEEPGPGAPTLEGDGACGEAAIVHVFPFGKCRLAFRCQLLLKLRFQLAYAVIHSVTPPSQPEASFCFWNQWRLWWGMILEKPNEKIPFALKNGLQWKWSFGELGSSAGDGNRGQEWVQINGLFWYKLHFEAAVTSKPTFLWKSLVQWFSELHPSFFFLAFMFLVVEVAFLKCSVSVLKSAWVLLP